MAWPKVRLGDVLRRSNRTVSISPDLEYREVTVKLWGKGVIPRGVVSGAKIAGSRRFVAKSGQFIMSRIDARNGAAGIVPDQLDGAVVTNDFPVFDLERTRVEPGFLGWLSKTHDFVDLCKHASEGTTNRVRLQEDRFLGLEIPLPPLAEQQRILARIEAMAAKIAEAQSLRHESMEEGERLLICMAHRRDLGDNAKQSSGWRRVKLRECIQLVDDSCSVEADKSYPNLGIYSFGRGLFHKPPIEGVSTAARTLRRVHRGQFIYSRLFAFEGAYGMVSEEFDGHFVSGEYPTFECKRDLIRAEFLSAYFRSAEVWKSVAVGSKGLGDRRQRVQPDQVLGTDIWLPPIALQIQLAEMQAKVYALKRLQFGTAAELNAILPAILDRAFKGEL